MYCVVTIFYFFWVNTHFVKCCALSVDVWLSAKQCSKQAVTFYNTLAQTT